MPTGQAIINGALKKLAVLEQGGTPNVSDSTDALFELNRMWRSWGVDEGLIYAVQKRTCSLSAGRASYTFGSAGTVPAPDFIGLPPQKIYDAYFTISSQSSASSALLLPATANIASITINDGNNLLVGTATIPGISRGSLTSIPGTANPLPLGVSPTAQVNDNDTVSFYAENLSGGPVTLPANVWSCIVIGLSGSSSVAVSAVIQQGTASFSGINDLMDGSIVPVGVVSVLGATPGSALLTPGVSGGALPDRVRLSASITALGSVTVYVENLTGDPVDIPALTYSIAVIAQSVATSGQSRNKLIVVSTQKYQTHRDLNATGYVPDEFAYDYDPDPVTGYSTGYLWPVSTAFPATLELVCAVNFSDWTLTDVYQVPRQLEEYIVDSLAYYVAPQYGDVVSDKVMAMITAQAEKAEIRVRKFVEFSRQLPPGGADLMPQQQQNPLAKLAGGQ